MKKILRILGFTLVESVGLSVWLALAAVNYMAALVLFLFLLVEHVLNLNTVMNRKLLNLDRIKGIIGFSLTETAAWVGWLLLNAVSGILAFAYLTVVLLIEHNQADNTLLKKPFFSRLLSLKPLGHTLVESVGCSVWLALVTTGQPIVGFVVLFTAILIHHIIAVEKGQKALAGSSIR